VKMNGKTGAAIKLGRSPNCGDLRSLDVIGLPIQHGMVMPTEQRFCQITACR
jgi:hypothetical protein